MNAPEQVNESFFTRLLSINVNDHKEKKGQFDYLSWPYAVAEISKADPSVTWEFPEPATYQNGTMMVFCNVSAFGKTMRGFLPVMDNRNNAIQNPDAFAINKAYMRCLVKTIAMFGLGLYIFAGEDLPEEEQAKKDAEEEEKRLEVENKMKEMQEGMKILNQFRENSLKGSAALKSFRSMCKGDVAKKVWAKHEASLLEAACKADEELAGAM